jgi:HSP20 family protein
MSKHKKSFFERLSGSVKITADEFDKETSLLSATEGPEEDSSDGELAVDVYQTPSEIVIRTMVAGIKPENLDISISRDMVTIKGSREESHEVSEGDYFHKELYWGSFSRTVMLPAEVEIEEAEAIEKNGLLTLRLPKIDKERQAKLKVKSSN